MEKNRKELPPIGYRCYSQWGVTEFSRTPVFGSQKFWKNKLIYDHQNQFSTHSGHKFTYNIHPPLTLLPSMLGQKQYALQVVCTADWLLQIQRQISRVSLLQALLMPSLNSKTCRISMFESSQSQRNVTEPG